MEIDVEGKQRTVIPRWRDFRTTLALGELQSSTPTLEDTKAEGSLEEQLVDWRENRSLAFATDLVGAGFVLGMPDEIQDAANFVLSEESHATELQRRIARQAIDPNYCALLANPQEITPTSGDQIINLSRQRVNYHRRQLRDGLRNPIELVELSREFATLGSIEKAVKAMDVAVGLAPANRFVLRSAARLFVHAGELDKAHHILKRAPSLRSDPWLLAAEIAVASMRDISSSSIRIGMEKISDDNYRPFDVSELSSAIATLEMQNANGRRARRLFKHALRKPTENSIAQAEWASRSMDNLRIEVRNYDAPRKYEALAWSLFKEGELDTALDQGKNWLRDQPFAVSPVTFSGMVASLMEDFEFGERVYRFGLRANPENATLRNNLAFALASNNEPDLAQPELDRIDRGSLTVQERIVVTATEGLISFRRGALEEGRALYNKAIEIARENKERSYVLRALIFLAREEIHARTPVAIKALESAEKEAKFFRPNQEMKMLFDRLIAAVKSDPDSFRQAVVAK
jgi:tetratricopeptide (TPR) repeat protein